MKTFSFLLLTLLAPSHGSKCRPRNQRAPSGDSTKGTQDRCKQTEGGLCGAGYGRCARNFSCKRTNLKYGKCTPNKRGRQSKLPSPPSCLSPGQTQLKVDRLMRKRDELSVKYESAVRELESYIDETKKCVKGQ